jgi:hypothetical protein
MCCNLLSPCLLRGLLSNIPYIDPPLKGGHKANKEVEIFIDWGNEFKIKYYQIFPIMHNILAGIFYFYFMILIKS